MRTRPATTIVLAGSFVLAAACSTALLTRHPVAAASVTLTDSAGATVATASLWQEADGIVHVDLQALNLSPGEHGIHFHSVAKCDPLPAPLFSSAGGHFNPLGKQHGLNNSAGPHAGDAPNFTVGADRRGKASFTTDRVTLTSGSTSLFDADGSALVIHAGADDQMSQPAGNSGPRVACGVVHQVIQ